jgi:hypothetical protein
MTKNVHGIIRGKTIELAEDLGVAEGQAVEVQVTVVGSGANWGAGLQRAAGALAGAWSGEDDKILDQLRRDRQQDSRREISE